MEQIHGVNLGNWLVLEKWMHPALFDGTGAEDEHYLPLGIPQAAYEQKIRTHRSEYICERDFLVIRSWGLDAVRIPVPYFVFGDRPPYLGCIEELDNAFDWAKRHSLKILIDLHTAPLGQNGFDNGGISGVCAWCRHPEEVEFELSVLERLSARYGHDDALWGIEVLNEPIISYKWADFHVQEKYIPVDKTLAAQSAGVPKEFLEQFYLSAYDRMDANLKTDAKIVIHDAFDMATWKDFARDGKHGRLVLDTHRYLMGLPVPAAEQTLGYYQKVINQFGEEISEMQRHIPVICGEWCLSNPRGEFHTELAKAQKEAWSRCTGDFFWSYKLIAQNLDAWDMQRCIARGWL